jgi:hypothetical protein
MVSAMITYGLLKRGAKIWNSERTLKNTQNGAGAGLLRGFAKPVKSIPSSQALLTIYKTYPPKTKPPQAKT